LNFFVEVKEEVYDSTDWQEEDLENLVKLEGSANWSEMGCYKTTSGIWLAERKIAALGELNFTPRLLIISSRNGKGTYYDALPKTLQPKGWRTFDVTVNGVVERLNDLIVNKWEISDFCDYVETISEPHVVLCHYHCFTNKSPVRQWLQRLVYTFAIVDEAHRIKNKDGQWTRHIKSLHIIAGKHVMTGTGFVNAPQEIWSLLNFLDPEQWSSFNRFKKHFTDEYTTAGGFKKTLGVKRETRDEFRELVRTLGPRREMRKVHSNIAEPITTVREVDLNPIQRAMFDQIKVELRMLDQKGVQIDSPNVLSLLNRLRQISIATPEKIDDYFDIVKDRRVQVIRLVEPSSKLDELMDLLEELRWDDEVKQKVVVFSQFKDPLELLKVRLEKKNIPYLHMEAHHNDEQRYKMWHDEWPMPNHQVFMSTLDLGGESINLTPGQYCVFLDKSWSPRANNQAVGRVYRPGQTEAVELIYVNARKTTDQLVDAKNLKKNGWFKEIFDEELPPDDNYEQAPLIEIVTDTHTPRRLPQLDHNRHYIYYAGNIIKCGECWETDIRKTQAGEYNEDEGVTIEDVTLVPEHEPYQCDDCLKQNAAYEEIE
jgi:hypothetical protein